MAIAGIGTTITYKKNATGATAVTIGSLTSIGEISPTADEMDVTTLDSSGGYREFIQGFKDSGEVSISGYHKDDNGQKAARTAFNGSEKGEFVITFPDGFTFTFDGFFKGYTVGSVEVDGAIGFGATIRISGEIEETKVTPQDDNGQTSS